MAVLHKPSVSLSLSRTSSSRSWIIQCYSRPKKTLSLSSLVSLSLFRKMLYRTHRCAPLSLKQTVSNTGEAVFTSSSFLESNLWSLYPWSRNLVDLQAGSGSNAVIFGYTHSRVTLSYQAINLIEASRNAFCNCNQYLPTTGRDIATYVNQKTTKLWTPLIPSYLKDR